MDPFKTYNVSRGQIYETDLSEFLFIHINLDRND